MTISNAAESLGMRHDKAARPTVGWQRSGMLATDRLIDRTTLGKVVDLAIWKDRSNRAQLQVQLRRWEESVQLRVVAREPGGLWVADDWMLAPRGEAAGVAFRADAGGMQACVYLGKQSCL